MPRGVYIRSERHRVFLSEKLGNKGRFDSTLIEAVSQIMAGTSEKLTLTQIHKELAAQGILSGDEKGYHRLYYQFISAFKSGRLDSSRICSGRGHPVYKFPTRFHVGDKVRIVRQQKRTPLWMRKELRLNNCRTVISTVPSTEKDAHTRYYLGINRIGNNYIELHAFRSEELEPFVKSTVGRPRSRRTYNRKADKNTCGENKDTSPDDNVSLMDSSVSPSISCVNYQVEV